MSRASPSRAARRRSRGAALLEQVVVLGLALLGLIGFSRFGTELHAQLGQEAEHIRGRGMPGSDLSLGAMASSYQPLPGSGRPQLPGSARPQLPGAGTSQPPAPGSGRPQGGGAPPNRSAAGDSAPGGSPSSSRAGNDSRGGNPGGSPSAAASTPVRSGPTAGSTASGSGGSGRGSSGGRASGSSSSSGSNPDLECGDFGRYKYDLGAGSESKKAPRVPPGKQLERDHIPQGHSLRTRAEQLLDLEIQRRVREQTNSRCRDLTPAEEGEIARSVAAEMAGHIAGNLKEAVHNDGFAITLPKDFHDKGRTHSNSSLAASEASDLGAAARADMDFYLDMLDDEVQAGTIDEDCAKIVRAVFEDRKKITTKQYDDRIQKIVLRYVKKHSGKLDTAVNERFAQEEKCQ